jgi:fructuronate reductase
MRYALGVGRHGERYDLRDPRAGEIAALLDGVPRNGAAVSTALFKLPGLFPSALGENSAWTAMVANKLDTLVRGDRLAAQPKTRRQ